MRLQGYVRLKKAFLLVWIAGTALWLPVILIITIHETSSGWVKLLSSDTFWRILFLPAVLGIALVVIIAFVETVAPPSGESDG